MNEYQHQLYRDLSMLCGSNEAFYHVDQELDGAHYRIFSYRLASYTDFLNPNALECRGAMFEIETFNGMPLRLVSLPFAKFFNKDENPFTQNLDLSKVNCVTAKMDGSLISTYIHRNNGFGATSLRLKSKAALASTQAVSAMSLIDLPKNKRFKVELLDAAMRDLTVIMEYIGPDNRIVLGYEKSDLVVLGVRDNMTGERYSFNDMARMGFLELCNRWVHQYEPTEIEDMIENLDSFKGIEGFVLEFANGQLVKIKTSDYLVLHKTKDSINSDRRLFEAIVMETSDDLRSLFYEDVAALRRIWDMEEKVKEIRRDVVGWVEGFYNANKDLDRKSYAIKGQAELPRLFFGQAMSMYLGKDVDYKTFMIKHYKELGIKEEEVIDDDNTE